MTQQASQNRLITNNLVDELKLNPATDIIPRHVVPTIQPTFMTNLNYSTSGGGASTNTSNAGTTALTTSSTQDTYLTAMCLSIAKDATCDNAASSLSANVTVNGSTVPVLSIAAQTLTAMDQTVSVTLANPLKLDRNSTVRLTNLTFTAGSCRAALNCIVMVKDSQQNLSV